MTYQQLFDDLKHSFKQEKTLTFEQLLNGVKGLESERTNTQINCFAEEIRRAWGANGAVIFWASLMESPDGNYYIPKQYDAFTITSLIAA